jgi:Bifunctional DNA primase/polymerase, N-terminal
VSDPCDLTQRGYWVFPCRECSKEPFGRTRGVNDASRDERTILHWHDKWPYANWGVALGPSDVSVLDIDPKYGASPGDVIGELELDAPVAIATGIAPEPDDEYPNSLAGERGAHLYYVGALDSVTRTRIPGVEIRSRGLYVIAPGGHHPSGVPYQGVLRPVHRLPPPPASVLALHAHGAQTYGKGTLTVPADGEPIEQGGRHEQLLGWAMDKLIKRGVVGREALDAMLVCNQQRVCPPLPPSEVRRLWRWADKSKIAERERYRADLVEFIRKRREGTI